MSNEFDYTMKFESIKEDKLGPEEIIDKVYGALKEKGYNPINQIVGYFISGDPTYITSHKDARKMIKQYERDELLEVIVKKYLEGK